jgi:iron(III) transport system ATP-binding protein
MLLNNGFMMPEAPDEARSAAVAPRASQLSVRGLHKRYGAVTAIKSIDLDVPAGSLVSLLGPSGCGKTTTLRCIAGLERPTGGTILVDDAVLTDEKSFLAPERRGMGMVFQSYALWPHMTVLENVAFGLRRRGRSRQESQDKAMATLAVTDMVGFSSRYPSELSGGQQQRVALSRALAVEPKVLLLDEPLSNLDTGLRESLRSEIRQLQQRLGITSLYVTHSQEEALSISDLVVVMSNGAIEQVSAPETIYRFPRNRFVAEFIGQANIFTAALADENAQTWVGRIGEASFRVRRPAGAVLPNAPQSILVRPESIMLRKPDQPATEENRLIGTLEEIALTGNLVAYFVRVEGVQQRVRIQATPPITAKPNERLAIEFSPGSCHVLDG